MNNRIKNLIAVAAFSLIILGVPAIATAQYGGYDPYGRNGGYNNGRNNGYGDMRSVIRDLKNRARDFQNQLDRDLDRSRYNGTRREDQMNALARNFRNAVDRLDNNNYYSGRNDDEMRRVFNEASQIERSIGRARVSYQSEAIWQGIRSDLQMLSGNYNRNNGRGNNGGWGNNRGNRNGLPSWWPF